MVALVALGGAVMAAPAGSAPTGSAAAKRCRNLKLTDPVRRGLAAAFERRRQVSGAGEPVPGETYYGACGSTRYAVAGFPTPAGLTPAEGVRWQDQPDIFRRRRGHRWRDLTDTGGLVGCHQGIPRRLLRIWQLQCQ